MIGYYVHHHGRGHLHRAVCVAHRLRTPVAGFSSLPRPAGWPGEWTELPKDTGAGAEGAAPTAGGTLHWAPLGHAGLRGRMGAIAGWIAEAGPDLFVSDVSVEVALLARLMGVPVVVAAMRGDRFDTAHRTAYDLADALLAPWPAAWPEPGWPDHWRAKTTHTGAFSRYDGRPRPTWEGTPAPSRRSVVVLLGAGGDGITEDDVRRAREKTPDWEWTVLGGTGGQWTDDPWPLLCRADAVVTHAGQNAIAECAAARTPALVIAQDRPHDEQRATARALHGAGLATVRSGWPAPEEWPGLLERTARAPADRWARWAPGDGADRAAQLLDHLATAGPALGRQPCAQR
ncbi:glycosyltransferase [Streptomyces sp. NPDC088745]|uniref:glycosyltransferase n=1 Tax=Streptomyces sp. NPDC088745 TaxID=3365884 RepID=UPI00380BAFB9